MEKAEVISSEEIASSIYSLWLKTEKLASLAEPGQFVSVYCNDASRLLPRPISICEIKAHEGMIRLVYRIAGKGTDEFSRLQPGDSLDLVGPLGKGFPLERCTKGKKAFLIGGGIGVPPMVQLSREIFGEVQVIAGYRDELFLTEELSECGSFYVATEDGSAGTRGNVLDCIRENKLEADVIFACGPMPMLRAIKAYAAEKKIECWISLEERMACGIGACLGCVCKSREIDDHSKVHNKRICTEGPVFLAEDVEI